LIKLKTPALLSDARRENGVTVIDQDQLQKITAEQDQTIADLKSLSSDVRVLFRYRLVLNAVAVVAPKALEDKLKAEMNVAYVEKEAAFERPKPLDVAVAGPGNGDITTENSVKFIGADRTGATGKGMKVGVIDTGIDYTHKMFGGAGTAAAYAAIDPSKPNPGFPTAKVVGGIDLVGTAYDASAGDYSLHIPVPDVNPLDEAGHGSHVSGTIAGHGDGVNTYDGVAPDASLYAIKVFGKNGSTGDAVVIAALEYAANPARNGDLHDQLDVVNLSLGSSFGQPHILYQEAIHNLSAGGTVVVASAGNEGDVDDIVDSPSVADDAISVAASVDDSAWNWKFPGVTFQMPTLGTQLVQAVEGAISKPLAQAGSFQGRLVDLGTLETDPTAAQVAAVKGQIALVARGVVTFADKIRRAQAAGAIAVVVSNDQDGDPIVMGGGDDTYDIPAFMITQDLGLKIKSELAKGDVKVSYDPSQRVQRPELIDTIAEFSSKGPRSDDGLLKPEISAPGYNVISAAMGKGDQGVRMSGTSMAGPHITGVMALLKQLHPDLSSLELKSLLMGHAKTIVDADKKIYPLSRQGAGRVQADLSAKGLLVSDTVDFSLGEISVQSTASVTQAFHLKNISSRTLHLHLSMLPTPGLSLSEGQDLTLGAGETKELSVTFLLNSVGLPEAVSELDGLVLLTENGQEIHRIPVLAVVKQVSQIVASASPNAVTLANKGIVTSDALIFNLLGQDARKQDANNDPFRTKACDLQAVGYRILTKAGDTQRKTLQFAIKIYDPISVWNTCEVSVLFDSNGDGVPDQELAGTVLGNIAGFSDSSNANVAVSVLLDATKARGIRADYEKAVAGPQDPANPPSLDYTPALVYGTMDLMKAYGHSTVAVVSVDVSKVALGADGLMHFKVATIEDENSAVEPDDFLGEGQGKTFTLSPQEEAEPFYGMPEVVTLAPNQSTAVPLRRGSTAGQVMVLMPENQNLSDSGGPDGQMSLMQPAPAALAN
jgi:subtilisin family serine protease